MIIFYHPTTGQIKAIYSHQTTSGAWVDAGYLRAEIQDATLASQASLDKAVTVADGTVTALIDWPRPALDAQPTQIAADGVDVSTITATFVDPTYAEAVGFSVDGGPAMQIQATNGRAQLTFGPVEVPGIYEIACNSPMYGINRITVEAI